MAYTNPNGQLAPSVGDMVLVTPFGALQNENHFAQVVSVDTAGLNATCRSVIPPNLCHLRNIPNEVQFTPYTASQLRVARP